MLKVFLDKLGNHGTKKRKLKYYKDNHLKNPEAYMEPLWLFDLCIIYGMSKVLIYE